MLLQHACFSPLQPHSRQPRGLGVCHGPPYRPDRLSSRAGAGLQCSGSSRERRERWHASRASALTLKQTALVSDGCRAAAARVVLGTTDSQLVAKRPERLPWCCAEARHSAATRRKRAGSSWPCSGSSRARRERPLSSRATALKRMATVIDGLRPAAEHVSCGTTALPLVAKLPASLQ